MPFMKSYILAVTSWLPYATQFATGVFVALFAMFGGMLGNIATRLEVC